jgi:DNA-binding XRE family transcriptional regulator
MTSNAGLRLRPKEDGTRSRILTIDEGRKLFGSNAAVRRKTAEDIELGKLDYALGTCISIVICFRDLKLTFLFSICKFI